MMLAKKIAVAALASLFGGVASAASEGCWAGLKGGVVNASALDAAGGKWRLRRGSPCVNGGALPGCSGTDLDLDGNPRIFGFGRKLAKPDMDCYESSYGALDTVVILR